MPGESTRFTPPRNILRHLSLARCALRQYRVYCMAGTCDEASRPGAPFKPGFGLSGDVQIFLARRGLGLLLRLSATAARMRSFRAASSTLSPSWMSIARLTFPSRLELNRPEGSCNAAPLGNVILTTLLYVSPVQTMPPWEKTGVPGDVGLKVRDLELYVKSAVESASAFINEKIKELMDWRGKMLAKVREIAFSGSKVRKQFR